MSTPAEHSDAVKTKGHRPHLVLRALLPVLFLIGAVWIGIVLFRTGPQPRREPRQQRPVMVDVIALKRTSSPVLLRTTGTVIPHREITLRPRVEGVIMAMHPDLIPGARMSAGVPLLSIDPADYRIALTNALVQHIRAEAEALEESGRQELAQHEWKALKGMATNRTFSELDERLALREPQRKRAQANLTAAQAAIEQARLRLDRTVVYAPFDGQVLARHADIGQLVTPQSVLLDFVGTETYWIAATLPTTDLAWLITAETDVEGASVATVRPLHGGTSQTTWQARVLRVLPALDPAGRQAQLLLQIDSSDELATAPLLGTYVEVLLHGPELEDVFAIPTTALHEGNTVWLLTPEEQLEIRSIPVVWSSRDTALVRNKLNEGEKLIVSNISAPLPGMLLTTGSDALREEMSDAQPPPAPGEPMERVTAPQRESADE